MAELTKVRRSPLAEMASMLDATAVASERRVRLTERPFTTMVSLRVEPSSAAAHAIEGVLGAKLPTSAGDVAEGGQHSVVWQGPDEWLVLSQTSVDSLLPELLAGVDGAHAAVVDVSANRTTLQLEGAAARAVLEKGCPLDLHPREFGPGRAVTTTLARVPLVLWQVGPESYRLMPRSSLADYVARWLLDAAQEFESDFSDGAGRS